MPEGYELEMGAENSDNLDQLGPETFFSLDGACMPQAQDPALTSLQMFSGHTALAALGD
jgi:hypothetical protein